MQNSPLRISLFLILLITMGMAVFPEKARAQEGNMSDYLKDRGVGIPTSMFGTYSRKGELLIYPFFEFYLNNNEEYSPAELGYDLDEDYRGKYQAYEGLMFVGYGITDWLALELEAAVIQATLETSSGDPTDAPDKIEESGLGDVEA
jgi:hypothetical protein